MPLDQPALGATAATVAPPATAGINSAMGTSTDYARADHTHATSVQKAVLVTGADGTVTWTFKKAFADTSYAVACLAGAAKIDVSWTNKTVSSITFVAKTAQPLPSSLLTLTALLNFDIFANPAAGVQLDCFAGAIT